MANPNPNEPNYPYSGGTDNPGDDTSKAGGGVMTETALLSLAGNTTNGAIPSQALCASVVRFPALPVGLPAFGSDTVLPPGMQAVPAVGTAIESAIDRGVDPEGGIDPLYGTPREAGQDETAGATETTSGASPAAFPEPNP